MAFGVTRDGTFVRNRKDASANATPKGSRQQRSEGVIGRTVSAAAAKVPDYLLPALLIRRLLNGKPRNDRPAGALKISWMLGGQASNGWAYAINTNRLVAELPFYRHTLNQADASADIAIYFDALIHTGTSQRGRHNILRLGGPRPLHRLFRGDIEKSLGYLRRFDAIIALNDDLARFARMSGVATYVVPNALDLGEWCSSYDPHRAPFVAGFAASVSETEERRLKGFDNALAACEAAGVDLLTLKRDEDIRIPHERMRDDFYGRISCLVHPVAEGKEGSSNVIMEALACGVPVITTRDCGFHAKILKDGKDVLYARRDKESLVACIERLRGDAELRARLSQNGRIVVERYHDITKIGREYRNIFASVAAGKRRLKVSLVPFGEQPEETATARVRCRYLADALNEHFGADCRADVGLADDADVIVVSELCSQSTLIRLQERKTAGALIVYDCCTPYYPSDQEIYGVHAAKRFWDLVDLADQVTVPTEGIKRLLVRGGVWKPISVVPSGVSSREHEARSLEEPIDGGFGDFAVAKCFFDQVLSGGSRLRGKRAGS